jgi:hypothetical protein
MSDCGFCLFNDYEGDDDDVFFGSTWRTARKEHFCCECGRTIQPGTKYAFDCGKWDGKIWTMKTCALCDEIAGAFACSGRIYGVLWDEMRESMNALTTACFDRLQTPEAKAELQKRWRQWKGLC